MKRKLAILAIIVGVVSIVMAIICFALSPGDNEYNTSYGGDAYTGIQNAAAQTARNIVRTNTIIKTGFGSLFLVAGIAFVGFGIVTVLRTDAVLEMNEREKTSGKNHFEPTVPNPRTITNQTETRSHIVHTDEFNENEKKNEFIPKYSQKVNDGCGIVEEGMIITFGSYEQDNDISNGKEKIEWLVLKVEGDKALVISKYALDCKMYNSFSSVTWETCSLRTWLNGTFLNTAFSSEEQNKIISSTVTADENPSYNISPGNNTTDKIFSFSITELNEYFSKISERKCQGTAYCHAQGAWQYAGNCWWWLRSPGGSSNNAACVNTDGYVVSYGNSVNVSNIAVRPALWIDLKA